MSLKCSSLVHQCSRLTTLTATRHLCVGVVHLRKKQEQHLYGRKKLRVLPVVHQIAGPHNSQYFTPYPQLTKEQMEEPPPPVSNIVRQVLEMSRGRYEGMKYIRPRLAPKKFKEVRKKMIEQGHVFPDEPLADRFLEPMPVVEDYILKKEERLKKIEENMKQMPEWIAEFKEEKRLKHEKLRKQALERKQLEWATFQSRKEKVLASGVDEKGEKKKRRKSKTGGEPSAPKERATFSR